MFGIFASLVRRRRNSPGLESGQSSSHDTLGFPGQPYECAA